MYRKLRANKIFDGFDWLEEGRVLVFDNNKVLIDVVSETEAGDNVEQLEGIIIPGLINAHCHTELSHLKGLVPERTGLIDFLITVMKSRSADRQLISAGVGAALREMEANGTVAVIDICNTTDALEGKKQSSLQWHNLIEVINLFDENLEKPLDY